MDIRTKLVFAFAAVTLGSMLVFGYFLYGIAGRMIGEGTTDQLDSLAGSGADAIETIIEGWQERVQLIGSRTQLRVSLRAFDQPPVRARIDGIQRILEDAAGSTRSVAAVAVYDRRGELVARAGIAADSVPLVLSSRSTAARSDMPEYLGVVPSGEAYPRVGYSMPLLLEGEPVGYLYVLLNGHRLIDLTADTTGLGRTGELMVVVRDDQERIRTLHPVRHPVAGVDPASPILLTDPGDPARLALADEGGVHKEGLRDYRGRAVWAATRYLPGTQWGLVVKYDTDEKRSGILEFKEEMIGLALALAGIGLLVAVILGLRFAGPIHGLAKTANQIRDGDLSARAPVKREDEIGLLARAFNQTVDELQERMMELHEFQKFFNVSLDLMCIAGTDGYFKLTNPAFTRVLGWSPEELTSQPFFALVHPDDVSATQDEIEKLSEGVPTISFVNRFRCADGSWVYLKWNSYPEPVSGLLYAIARETRAPLDD